MFAQDQASSYPQIISCSLFLTLPIIGFRTCSVLFSHLTHSFSQIFFYTCISKRKQYTLLFQISVQFPSFVSICHSILYSQHDPLFPFPSNKLLKSQTTFVCFCLAINQNWVTSIITQCNHFALFLFIVKLVCQTFRPADSRSFSRGVGNVSFFRFSLPSTFFRSFVLIRFFLSTVLVL